MRGKLVGAFVVGAALFGSAVVHADSMRCGSKLVNESATVDELLSKCGQPQDRQTQTEDQYALNPNTGARVKTGLQIVKERWIYKPTPGALPMAVQIVDGKIVSIQRAD
jgi:hypothetical protein